jgi:hypothetical protein
MCQKEGESTELDQNEAMTDIGTESQEQSQSILETAKEVIAEHLPNTAVTKIAETAEKIQEAAANAAEKWNDLSPKQKKIVGVGALAIVAIGAIGMAIFKQKQKKKSLATYVENTEAKAAAWFANIPQEPYKGSFFIYLNQ